MTGIDCWKWVYEEVKTFLIILAASFIPIWKDDMSNRGLNMWEYIKMAANRKHILVDQALENYRRNLV